MNARTAPYFTVRNIARVSTKKETTRVTVILATHNTENCVLVRMTVMIEWISG